MDHRRIYADGADDYDRLVAAEDCDGQLLPALSALVPLVNAEVVEIGVGTGRITRLLAGAGAHVVGCEPSVAMLAVARRHLDRLKGARVELHACLAQDFVIPPGSFDLAIAGWVFGHFVSWFPSRWREEIGAVLDRMLLSLRPQGALVVIETLGTGERDPRPPSSGLAAYYDWLERDRGFRRQVLRTDYAFPDVERAAAKTGAFFGEAFAARVRREQWARVPECTGLWWRRA